MEGVGKTQETVGDRIWAGVFLDEDLRARKTGVEAARYAYMAQRGGDDETSAREKYVDELSGLSSDLYSRATHYVKAGKNDARGAMEAPHAFDKITTILGAAKILMGIQYLIRAGTVSRKVEKIAGGTDGMSPNQLDVRQSILRRLLQPNRALVCIEAGLSKIACMSDEERQAHIITDMLLRVGLMEVKNNKSQREIADTKIAQEQADILYTFCGAQYHAFLEIQESVANSGDSIPNTFNQIPRLARALHQFYTQHLKQETDESRRSDLSQRIALMETIDAQISQACNLDPEKRIRPVT